MATVPASPRSTTYTLASASDGPFDVGFRIFDATLSVYVNDILRDDYTVTATFSAGYSDTATITFDDDLDIGDVIRIDGAMPISRAADYLNPDPSLTAKINIELGRVWAALQQLARDTTRGTPIGTFTSDFFQIKAVDDGAVNLQVETLDGAVSYYSASGGTTPFGPTLNVEGVAADIPGYFAAKGKGGWTFGNALGRLLELVETLTNEVANRILKISHGFVGTSYASLDAEHGIDLKASGDTLVRLLAGAGGGTAHVEIEAEGTDYVAISTPAGKSLVLKGGDGSGGAGTQLHHITHTDYQYTRFDVVNGGTVNVSAFSGVNLINPATGIAGLTINFPASPGNGNVVHITTWNAITTVTWASLGGHSIVGEPVGLTVEDGLEFMFATGFGWKRI